MIISRLGNNRGQAISEYGIILAVVVGAMLTMNTFIRRYVQAEMRDKTDEFLAISTDDATDTDLRTKGMETQRLGIDQLLPGRGINGSNTTYSASTGSQSAIRESTSTAGGPVVSQDFSLVVRNGEQESVTVNENPGANMFPAGRWFHKKDQGLIQRPQRQNRPTTPSTGGGT